jgi:hypothetical protein
MILMGCKLSASDTAAAFIHAVTDPGTTCDHRGIAVAGDVMKCDAP